MEIFVYTIPLDIGPHRAAQALDSLSEDERERAQRFVFTRDRLRFCVAHSELRNSLAQCAGADLSELRFGTLPGGKPIIEQPRDARRWHFNLSHSGRFALLAISDTTPVGVDIERKRVLGDEAAVAKRFFSAAEQQTYFQVSTPLKKDTFFAIWTRKEAYIKAIGLGLAMPLQAFDVSTPGDWLAEPRIRSEKLEGNRVPDGHWQIRSLETPEGYAGALAVRGQAKLRIHYRSPFATPESAFMADASLSDGTGHGERGSGGPALIHTLFPLIAVAPYRVGLATMKPSASASLR